MSLRTFFRIGAWYQATEKALSDDLEATAIVSNADPYDPVIVGGGGVSLPTQTGHAGEFLTTDGTDASWDAVSGSTPTLDEVLAEGGTLTDNRTVGLDGNTISFKNGAVEIVINPTGNAINITTEAGGTLTLFAGDDEGIIFNDTAKTATLFGSLINENLVPLDFANDAAAAAATPPIAVGGFYHTSGTLKVRLS